MKDQKTSAGRNWLIVVVLALLGGVALYFGGTSSITWLCIVGFILTAFAFLEADAIGKVAAVLIIIVWVLAKVFGWFDASSNAIVRWLFSGGIGLYTIARLGVVVCGEMLLCTVIQLNDRND